MKKILLVEDDGSLGATLCERLEKETYDVQWARTYAAALDVFQKNRFDLVILDVGLPDGSGMDLARDIRKTSLVPFIFVTALGDAEHRLRGYEVGAEEYVPKPFHLKEILLRVRHVLENHALKSEVRLGDTRIEFDSLRVLHGDHVENMTPKEAGILRALIERSPVPLSRDEILNSFWGEDEFPTNRTVDNVIVRLRQVLGTSAGKYIRTVRGLGYQWRIEDEEDAHGQS